VSRWLTSANSASNVVEPQSVMIFASPSAACGAGWSSMRFVIAERPTKESPPPGRPFMPRIADDIPGRGSPSARPVTTSPRCRCRSCRRRARPGLRRPVREVRFSGLLVRLSRRPRPAASQSGMRQTSGHRPSAKLSRKPRTRSLNARGASRLLTCPQSGITVRIAPGIRRSNS